MARRSVARDGRESRSILPREPSPDAGLRLDRLPPHLQARLGPLLRPPAPAARVLEPDRVHLGDARALLPRIAPNSVALGFWSPPYFVGKDYEAYLSYEGWERLLETVIGLHFPLIRPGGFLVINIADI
ncbi:MAG: DNA methyltransferase, partial [Planctomycetota bacterium]